MNMFLLNILLGIAWSALTGRFAPVDLIFGFGLGYAVLWVVTRIWRQERYFKQISRLIGLAVYFLMDLLRANFRLAATILSPHMKLRPAVVSVPLELKTEAGISLLANLITLTPGTLSLDISNDRQILYVHTVWLDNPEKFRRQISEGYERRIKELVEP